MNATPPVQASVAPEILLLASLYAQSKGVPISGAVDVNTDATDFIDLSPSGNESCSPDVLAQFPAQ